MADGKNTLTYKDAGVDIDAGNALVDRIKPAAAATARPGVMEGLGGFGAGFDLKAAGFADPVLVAATDGVGTKLRVAIETGRLGGVGVDLVAMCVNDLVCQGAAPLFFLDYYATAKLDVDEAATVVEGIAEGCRQAGCALVGGETAEMPGMYAKGDFDLAGFAVGAMERGAALPRPTRPGDVIIGVMSSGVHSNGFSLVRRIVEAEGLGWDDAPFGQPLGAALLAPTLIYVKPALAAPAEAFAHITGGGVSENLPRALAPGQGAEIDLDAWARSPLFNWLIKSAGLDATEALRTFNCGIGFTAITRPENAEAVIAAFADDGHSAMPIGHVTEAEGVAYSGSL